MMISLPHNSKKEAFTKPAVRRFARLRGGFTLVEVTLSIGIIGFAFVTIFGMLPVGLNVSRQAIDETIEAQIVQHLKTQALQTDFSKLETLEDAAPYYFDDQGTATESANANYKAGFESALPETGLPEAVKSTRLATVQIYVMNIRGNSEIAGEDPNVSDHSSKFSILIPDNGL